MNSKEVLDSFKKFTVDLMNCAMDMDEVPASLTAQIRENVALILGVEEVSNHENDEA